MSTNTHRPSFLAPNRYFVAAYALLFFLLLTPATAFAQTGIASWSGAVESIVKAITVYLARFVEGIAALVIGIASVRALWSYLATAAFARSTDQAPIPKEQIRLSLGRSLALALEFELGADILNTAVAPTWNEVGLLAAIAVLRTALNYFLERELRNAQARDLAIASSPEGG